MKKFLSLILCLMLALSVSIPAMAEQAPLKVAIVVAGTLGDRSFYDSANAGLQKLAEDKGVIPAVLECKDDASLYSTQMVSAAENNDFVVAVGWEFWDALTEIAPQLEDTKFIFVDNGLDGIDNVASIVYAQNEGSYLVGYIAGKMTGTNKVGSVGGEDSDVINDFLVGYEAGAKAANPDIEVFKQYAGDYSDPAKGKENALALYSMGCDIVFQVAGKTGEGVFEAAAETGNYAIGVDSDQKYINPDVILCSMIKDVGGSIYTAVSNFIDSGEFRGGEIWMADGYVGVGYGDDSMPQQVSPELKAEVEQISQRILSGEIEVPSALQ